MKQSWQRLPGLDNGTVSLANSSHTSHSTRSADRSLATIRQELESILFEVFILHRAQLDSRLKVAGFVWEGGKKVETGGYIQKGVIINTKRGRKFKPMPGSHQASQTGSGANTSSQSKKSKSMSLTSQTGTEAQNWKRSPQNSSGARQDKSRAAFVSRTLVRIVLNIPGCTIQHCANMTEFLRGFRGAIEGEFV